jgi:hypothetical protein
VKARPSSVQVPFYVLRPFFLLKPLRSWIKGGSYRALISFCGTNCASQMHAECPTSARCSDTCSPTTHRPIHQTRKPSHYIRVTQLPPFPSIFQTRCHTFHPSKKKGEKRTCPQLATSQTSSERSAYTAASCPPLGNGRRPIAAGYCASDGGRPGGPRQPGLSKREERWRRQHDMFWEGSGIWTLYVHL